MNTGAWANASMLQRTWERQGGRCAFTGFPLTPGVSASIDHLIPTARGGTDEDHNLAWVALKINLIKNDLTRDEFVELCRLVVAVADGAQPEISPRMAALLSIRKLKGGEKAKDHYPPVPTGHPTDPASSF
jgi:hypothetical protein